MTPRHVELRRLRGQLGHLEAIPQAPFRLNPQEEKLVFPGRCWEVAFHYFQAHPWPGVALIHGWWFGGLTGVEPNLHAWCQVPGNIIYSPTLNQFYRARDFTMILNLEPWIEYPDPRAAARLLQETGRYGPWHLTGNGRGINLEAPSRGWPGIMGVPVQLGK
jgi:hypothetical protein